MHPLYDFSYFLSSHQRDGFSERVCAGWQSFPVGGEVVEHALCGEEGGAVSAAFAGSAEP